MGDDGRGRRKILYLKHERKKEELYSFHHRFSTTPRLLHDDRGGLVMLLLRWKDAKFMVPPKLQDTSWKKPSILFPPKSSSYLILLYKESWHFPQLYSKLCLCQVRVL